MVEITRTHGSDTGATLPKRQRSLRRLQSGQSLLEVSLTLTILFLLFSGIVDLGRAFMTVVSLTNMISEGTQWAAAFPGCIAYARNATDAPQIPVNCRGTNSIIGRIINENTNLDLARVVNMSVTPVTAAPGDQVVITVTYQLPTITPIFQSMFGRNLTLTAQSIELVRGTDVPTYPGGHTDQPPNLSPISPVSYVSYQCDHGNAKLTWAAVAGVSGYDIFQGPVTTHASASYSFSTTADPVVFPTTGVPGAGASAVLNITTFNDDGAGHFTLGTPYTLTVSCAVMKPLNSIAYSCQPHGATFTWNMPTNVGNSLDLAVSYYRIYYGGTSTQIGSNFAAVSNPQSASILFAANPPDGTRSYEIQAFDSFGNPAGPRSDPVTLGCLPHYADLALSLVGNPSPYVVRANQLVYTLTVTNGGALAATNVVMVDTLDPNEHFSSVSVVPSSPDCIYENPTLIPDVKCTFASMADGESKIITITVTAPDALTTITNSATVSSDLEDNDSSNNWRSITTTVTDPPDVAITMSGTPSVVAVGGSVTYTLTVTDGPEAPVGGLTVMTDPLPAGLTFGGCTPAPCNYISDPADAAYRRVKYSVGVLLQGQTLSPAPTLTINVPTGYTGPASFTNTVTVTPSDATPADNTASVTTQIIDVQLASFTGSPSSVVAGSNVTFTIQVSNPSGPDAPNVTVTQTVPSSLIFVPGSSSASCSAAAGTATCTLGALSAGASTSVTLVFTIPSPYTGTNPFISTAIVTPSDPTPNDNSSSYLPQVSIQVLQPDLTLAGTSTGFAGIAGTVQAGSNSNNGNNLTYSFTVQNAGTAAASGVVLSTTAPTGLTFSAAANAGWTQSGVNLTYSIGSVAVGATASPTLKLGVLRDYQVVTPFSLTSLVTPSDNNPANNTTTISTTVTAPQILNFTGTCSHQGAKKYQFSFTWDSYPNPAFWGATQFKIATPFSSPDTTWTVTGGTATSTGGFIPSGGVTGNSNTAYTFTITAWNASAAISSSLATASVNTTSCP